MDIAASPSPRLDALTDRAIMGLRAAMAAVATRRVVLIYDPTPDDDFVTSAKTRGLPTAQARIITSTQKHGPWLIDVGNELRHEPFINESLRLAVTQALQPAAWDQRQRTMCAWWISTAPLHTLATMLASHSWFVDAHGVRRTLRLWDPRTIQHAQRLFGAAQPHSGFENVSWSYIDSLGQWQTLPPPAHGYTPTQPAPQTLRELSLMNAALQRLAIDGLPETPTSWPALQESIRAGMRAGLQDDDDLAWFAADRSRLRAPIEHARSLAELFAVVRSGNGRYVRATGDYDETDWAAVVQSIPATTPLTGEAP